MKVKEVMTTDLVTVFEDTTLREVVGLMLEKNISGLPVVEKGGELKGIVSESDIIRLKRKLHMPDYMQLLEAMLNNARPDEFNTEILRALKMPAKDFMTKRIVTASEDTSLAEITRLMSEHDINRIPIVRGSRLIGMMTRRDAIKAMANLEDI